MIDQSANRTWVARLSEPGIAQSEAISELRTILFERLERAFRSNHNVDTAFIEDAVQDGLIAILKSVDDFEGRSRFTTWCTTIVVRIAITELRRRHWKDVSLEGLLEDREVELPIPSLEPVSESELQKSQILNDLRRLIATELTDKQRTVIQAELMGMPQSEIAGRLGSSRNAVYKLGHDARKKLKQQMIQAGYSPDDLNHFVGTSS